MTARVHNFNPGPAVLPTEVLENAARDLIDFRSTGMGILEVSHRSADFEALLGETDALLRELLSIPADYSIIFPTGGATNQFSMVPMNLLEAGTVGNYIVTGYWAEKAAAEAKKFGEVHIAASSKEDKFSFIPKTLDIRQPAAYLHFTSNNTIVGTEFQTEPDAGGALLVCDASSDILSRPIDVKKYGIIYAGAQKNLGPAGVTLVILKKELAERAPKTLPVMMRYETYTKNNSLYNTPPVFAIYILHGVLQWVKKLGGISAIDQRNEKKAHLLYDYIENSGFYYCPAKADSRSRMNVVFKLNSDTAEPQFLKEAKARNLVGLKGHRDFGGLRASLYNALDLSSVEELVNFMKDFARVHGSV